MDKATFLKMMDQYIDGTLSSTEKYDFDQMVRKDPLLQKEFDMHKAIRNGIKKSARKDLLEELNVIKNEIKPAVNIRKIIPRWYLLLAAVFLGIVCVIFMFTNEMKYKENDFANYSKIEHNPYEGDTLRDRVAIETYKEYSYKNSHSEKDTISSKKRFVEYSGRYDLKILPLDGKLGGASSLKIDLILKPYYLNAFILEGDTLFIFTEPEIIENIRKYNPLITLTKERNLVIDINQKKYIFKPKK